MWNTPTLPACLLSQANITQSACVAKQSESQWLVMVTLPDRTTFLVTSHPIIHFLLKIVAVVETLDGFMDPLTLICFSFFGLYWRELNFYELFYFCGLFFFFFKLFALISVPKSLSEDGFSLVLLKQGQFLRQYRGNSIWQANLFISPSEKSRQDQSLLKKKTNNKL